MPRSVEMSSDSENVSCAVVDHMKEAPVGFVGNPSLFSPPTVLSLFHPRARC